MIPLAVFEGLARVPRLRHAVTGRAGGASGGPFAALNLSPAVGDDPAAVRENRRRVAAALGFPDLRTPRQEHGVRILEADARDPEDAPADGLTLSRPGVLVGVLGADCPGVLLVERGGRALAVLHAGWRGVTAGIVAAGVAALAERHGVAPRDLCAAVGPGVSGARYEVGPEVVAALRARGLAAPEVVRPGRGDRSHVDLASAVRLALVAAGVPPGRVEVSRTCTFGDAKACFSHRRDGPRTGRHALVAGFGA